MKPPYNPISKWWKQNYFQKFGTTVWVLISSNQNYNIYVPKILDGKMKRQIKMAFIWKSLQFLQFFYKSLHLYNSISKSIIIKSKSKFLSSIAWIDPNLPTCYNISETQKFNMDYNFHIRIPLAGAHNKHILIILVIDSRNFRKLHVNDLLNLNEMRTEHKRYNTLLIKR